MCIPPACHDLLIIMCTSLPELMPHCRMQRLSSLCDILGVNRLRGRGNWVAGWGRCFTCLICRYPICRCGWATCGCHCHHLQGAWHVSTRPRIMPSVREGTPRGSQAACSHAGQSCCCIWYWTCTCVFLFQSWFVNLNQGTNTSINIHHLLSLRRRWNRQTVALLSMMLIISTTAKVKQTVSLCCWCLWSDHGLIRWFAVYSWT